MSYFDPESFPREPQGRTLVWGEHDLSDIVHGEIPVGSGVEVMGFHITALPSKFRVQPDGYLDPVAVFTADDYNTPLHLMADLSAWSTLVWTEMDTEDRRECFTAITHDREKGEEDGYVYVPECEPEDLA